MGRATQGVTLIAVEDGTSLSGLQRIVETDIDEADGEGVVEGGAADAAAPAEPAAE
jgi:DNA gyrase subunit A